MCPSANGMTTPSGLSVVSPWIGYVTKLGLSCSPSVITGEPVASSSPIVSSSACSKSAFSSSPATPRRIASISSGGRGTLPIGSVGIDIACMLAVQHRSRQVRRAG